MLHIPNYALKEQGVKRKERGMEINPKAMPLDLLKLIISN